MLFEFLISARLINSGRLWNTNNTISDIFSDIQRINFSKASTSRLKLKLLSSRNNSGRQYAAINAASFSYVNGCSDAGGLNV